MLQEDAACKLEPFFFFQLTAEEEELRKIRREKNKLAAQKCRSKKRERAEVLEAVSISFFYIILCCCCFSPCQNDLRGRVACLGFFKTYDEMHFLVSVWAYVKYAKNVILKILIIQKQ